MAILGDQSRIQFGVETTDSAEAISRSKNNTDGDEERMMEEGTEENSSGFVERRFGTKGIFYFRY